MRARVAGVRTARALVVLGVVVGLAACALALDLAAAFSVANGFDRPNYRLPVSTVAGGPVTVLVLGDSLAYGYGATTRERNLVARLSRCVARLRPGSGFVNEAAPGAHIGDLRLQLAHAPAHSIDAVLVVAGANDVRVLTNPVMVAVSERRLLDAIHLRYPLAPVVLTNVPDVSDRMFHARPLHRRAHLPAPLRFSIRAVAAIDDRLVESIAAHRAARVIDLYDLSHRRGANDPTLVSGDGLHPSDAGYAKLAAFAWPAFGGILRSTQTVCS